MREGERQVAPDLSGIRPDHTARYKWAARNLPRGSHILDLACGVGYGAYIMAEAGHRVLAVDNEAEAIGYGQAHFAHKKIAWLCQDARTQRDWKFDAVTCFETIEHLEDPRPMLKMMADAAPTLLASVPNEEKFPYRNYKFHFRHYTRSEFEELLRECGWEVTEWWGQQGLESDVLRGVNGRTVVVMAKRASAKSEMTLYPGREQSVATNIGELIKSALEDGQEVTPLKPMKRVAIVGLGPTAETYVHAIKCLGARAKLCDEVWGINAIGDALNCDLLFHMDDVRIQEARAAAEPNSNIAAMLTWMKTTNVPIITSRAHPDYPSLVEFPLEEVFNKLCPRFGATRYFNNTAAYAIAYAIFRGDVWNIQCYGMDFSYPDSHRAEKGRGCVEFWLGVAHAYGIKLSMPNRSTLMDACVPDNERLYGYDTVDVEIAGPPGANTVTFVERERTPTAEEIEHRYDHNRHTNSISEAAQGTPQ